MTEDADPRPYGRRAFLALLAGGASSFVWAPAASNFLSPLTSAFSQALGNILPVGGWRIYTISGSMPVFDPKTWRLEIGGLVRRPVSISYQQLLALPSGSHRPLLWHYRFVASIDLDRLARPPTKPTGVPMPAPSRLGKRRRPGEEGLAGRCFRGNGVG